MTTWAITAYYNPARFRRRYDNYQVFRRALPLPLLTVEWSPGGRFDLAADDADELLQIRGGDLMWQKERLLNLAVAQLPPDCRQVAWLDCDVVYPDPGWVSALDRALGDQPLVQLFANVVHLPALPPGGQLPAEPGALGSLLTREALARQGDGWVRALRTDAIDAGAAVNGTPAGPDAETLEQARMARRPSAGHAWAARRELLDEFGLYDACICGVGDMATGLAALGQAEAFAAGYPLNGAQRAHYLAWAGPFGEAVGGRVGCLPDTLYHLFHGRMVDRQYRTRLGRLAGAGFDPGRDLRPAPEGPWEWSGTDPQLAQYMRDFFQGRQEDA